MQERVTFPIPTLGTKVTTTLLSSSPRKSSNSCVIPNVSLLPANSDLSSPLGESASSFTYTSNFTLSLAGNPIPPTTNTSCCLAFSESLRLLGTGLATSTLIVESKVNGNLV
ncbi:hypothetical protein D8674_002175 [Pyrus ussuriensis x Pyrus communis]|uniref:Uncharacterized protein n=1 Tax=Pyrus ussuriensis x Pyrus communis TaxID=2448454 RepID=A0A5N5FIV9_9ROSA|nr:hypothetical protein D8674_002175 [Pyrus ussuriensis x Pyrus communis]